MKKLIFKTGSLFLAIGFSLITLNSVSQEAKLTSQEQKDAKRAVMYVNNQIMDSLLTSHSFVLKADFLENQYGERIIVLPLLNFIRVDSTRAVLQTGSVSNLGYNGVGGVTAEGNINDWKLIRDSKNLSFQLQFSILTSTGYYDVIMRIGADNYVQATISGITRGNMTYDGHLEKIEGSRIYKGQNL
jgi:hypothetical protein